MILLDLILILLLLDLASTTKKLKFNPVSERSDNWSATNAVFLLLIVIFRLFFSVYIIWWYVYARESSSCAWSMNNKIIIFEYSFRWLMMNDDINIAPIYFSETRRDNETLYVRRPRVRYQCSISTTFSTTVRKRYKILYTSIYILGNNWQWCII
jgi:hypothetical protein